MNLGSYEGNFCGQQDCCGPFRFDSDLFTVSRSGAAVTFTGSDGTVFLIPATTVSQTVAFDDGKWRLVINSGRVMLGDQEVETVAKGLIRNNILRTGSKNLHYHFFDL